MISTSIFLPSRLFRLITSYFPFFSRKSAQTHLSQSKRGENEKVVKGAPPLWWLLNILMTPVVPPETLPNFCSAPFFVPPSPTLPGPNASFSCSPRCFNSSPFRSGVTSSPSVIIFPPSAAFDSASMPPLDPIPNLPPPPPSGSPSQGSPKLTESISERWSLSERRESDRFSDFGEDPSSDFSFFDENTRERFSSPFWKVFFLCLFFLGFFSFVIFLFSAYCQVLFDEYRQVSFFFFLLDLLVFFPILTEQNKIFQILVF